MTPTFSKQVFRGNDIRGQADTELTNTFARALGAAFAKQVLACGENCLMLCRDARNSSPRLHKHLIEGIHSKGVHIQDLGIGPTPLLGFALATSDKIHSGIMITASHSPKEQNGFKFTLAGKPFFSAQLAALYEQLEVTTDSQTAQLEQIDATQSYLQTLQKYIGDLGGLKIVIDAANGATGPLAIRAFKSLGLELVTQFCEPDGEFPNRSPDTSDAKNLSALQTRVLEENADMGIGFDGDGDRMVAVTAAGRLLDADDLIALFAESALAVQPNVSIVYDVKCSTSIAKKVAVLGGKGIMERSGRSYLQTRMAQENAAFAGEYSAHYFFADRWYGTDDGIYAACRLLEICKLRGQPLEEICPPVSAKVATGEIYVTVAESEKFALIDALREEPNLQINNEVPLAIRIDGLRLEYENGWALVRASNTAAALTLRFEALSECFMQDLKNKICTMLTTIAADIDTDGIRDVT